MRVGPQPERFARVLFLSSFFVATCGLVYELVAGAMASYLLGDSVTQFSLVIGCYLSAMGVGSWLSRFIDRHLLARFVEVEVAVALLGGFEAPILFAAFAYTDSFRIVLFSIVALVGVLVGLEIPLLIRILEKESSLKELVARVMFLDYIGALVASIAFPLLLLPGLGLLRTSLVLGLVNAAVAAWTLTVFSGPQAVKRRLALLTGGTMVALLAGLLWAGTLEKSMEQALYADPIVFHKTTPYQRIVVTHADRDTRLYLNGGLQFSSVDEYRYHEALVHVPMAASARRERVLVLGGGDGLAVREVLRWPEVKQVVLVDLDPEMTRLFSEHSGMVELNDGALQDPRVEVVNADAFGWLKDYRGERFDTAMVDFPDPHNFGVGKLYTAFLFQRLRMVMAEDGVAAVQSTSPLFSRDAFWCIHDTLEEGGWLVDPYHVHVPTFGEWGFNLIHQQEVVFSGTLPPDLRFIDDDTIPTLFHFPRDAAARGERVINRLDNQALVRLYERDWRRLWN